MRGKETTMVATENKPRPGGVVDEPLSDAGNPQLSGDGVGFEYQPPMSPMPPAPTRPAPATHPASQLFVPILLIGLGIFFLVGNVLTIGGGALFIGLGLVFLAARII